VCIVLIVQDQLVAVTSFCRYPEEATHKEKIGGLLDPNIEKMIALKPTHLFGVPSHKELDQELAKFGLNITMIPNECVADVLSSIEIIAKKTGRQKQAERLIKTITQELDSFRLDEAESHRISAVLIIGREQGTLRNITVAGNNTYLDEIWQLVGGSNCYADLPTRYGSFKLHLYENTLDSLDNPIALVKGDISGDEPVLVRVHSECLTGDIFGSKRCDCGEQLLAAMSMVERAGRGVVLYMRQEGRGIGLVNKLLAYHLQEQGKDTVEANEALGFKADLRDYGTGAQILKDLGLKKIKLLTNNPKKLIGLKGYDLEIVERIPLEIVPNPDNEKYLKTKRDRLGHLLYTEKKL